ncbi:hypothetical protein D9M69_719560 [compost metagenome]
MTDHVFHTGIDGLFLIIQAVPVTMVHGARCTPFVCIIILIDNREGRAADGIGHPQYIAKGMCKRGLAGT